MYSDYPAKDKLVSLGLPRMEVVCSTDEGLCRLKPDPEGLLTVARRLGLPEECCVFIGDREDTDRESAKKAGMPFSSQEKAIQGSRTSSPTIMRLLEEASEAMNGYKDFPGIILNLSMLG